MQIRCPSWVVMAECAALDTPGTRKSCRTQLLLESECGVQVSQRTGADLDPDKSMYSSYAAARLKQDPEPRKAMRDYLEAAARGHVLPVEIPREHEHAQPPPGAPCRLLSGMTANGVVRMAPTS